MNSLDLSIKFVNENIPVPSPGNDSVSVAANAQTGDFWVFIVAIVFALFAISIAALVLAKRSRSISGLHVSMDSKSFFLNLFSNTWIKELFVFVVCLFGIAIVVGGASNLQAQAKDEVCPLSSDYNPIQAKVSSDGTFNIDVCTVTNIGQQVYTIGTSNLFINDEVADIPELESTYISIKGLNGKVFEGSPTSLSGNYQPEGLDVLYPADKTTLNIEISFKDPSVVQKLIDKNVFTISLVPKKDDFPLYKTLEEYSWKELQTVSNAISKGEIRPRELERFENFAEEGQYKCLALGANENAEEDYLYMRIIGINNDVKSANNEKAGLTFMAANSINKGYCFESSDATTTINWQNSKLRENMNTGEIFSLINSALNNESVTPQVVNKEYAKGYLTSSDNFDETDYSDEILISQDTFFLPSYYEITGDNIMDIGYEGTKYPYIKNDMWLKKSQTWHNPEFRGCVMSSTNWKGYLWFQDKGPIYDKLGSGSKYLNQPIKEAFKECLEAGGGINECYWTGTLLLRSLSADYDTYVECMYCSGDALHITDISKTACVTPCFCL